MNTPADIFRQAIRAAVREGYFTPQQGAEIADKLILDMNLLPGHDVLNVSVTPDAWPSVFLELLSLANNGWQSDASIHWMEAQQRIAAMKLEQLLQVHEKLQDQFERRNSHLAMLLFSGGVGLAAWRWNFWQLVRKLHISQLALGAGRVPNPPDWLKLTGNLGREAAYVDRFSESVFAGLIGDRSGIKTERRAVHSEDGVRSRGDLYSGPARGLFYEANEEYSPLELGWVIHYVAKDDNGTCRPCHEAQGYYLPNHGPMPGQVCEGRGKCRCQRVAVFAPAIYNELVRVVA